MPTANDNNSSAPRLEEMQKTLSVLTLLLQEAPEVLRAHVCTRLDSVDLAMLARVNRTCKAAAADSGLPLAGSSAAAPFIVNRFMTSLEKLEFAFHNGCPWTAKTCEQIVLGDHYYMSRHGQTKHETLIKMLQWARDRNIAWNAMTFYAAAVTCTTLELLDWLWERQCPSDFTLIVHAAGNSRGIGREAITWARDHGMPWDEGVCSRVALDGNLELLKWLREPEQQCPWDSFTLYYARMLGHDELYEWAATNGCPQEEESDDDDDDDENESNDDNDDNDDDDEYEDESEDEDEDEDAWNEFGLENTDF